MLRIAEEQIINQISDMIRLATIPIQMTTSERFDGLNDKCRHRYLLKIIIHLPIDLNDLIQQENFCLTTVVS